MRCVLENVRKVFHPETESKYLSKFYLKTWLVYTDKCLIQTVNGGKSGSARTDDVSVQLKRKNTDS